MPDNQRIRLSKQMLRDSLLSLMKTKSIYKISIKEICEKAEVNRSTFYKHYNTEFDLLKDIENEYLTTIQNFIILQSGSITLTKLINYVNDNIDVFMLFLNNTPGNSFLQRLIEWCFEIMLSDEKLLKKEWLSYQSYVFQFIIHGCINVVIQWVGNKGRESTEELNEILLHIVSKFLNV